MCPADTNYEYWWEKERHPSSLCLNEIDDDSGLPNLQQGWYNRQWWRITNEMRMRKIITNEMRMRKIMVLIKCIRLHCNSISVHNCLQSFTGTLLCLCTISVNLNMCFHIHRTLCHVCTQIDFSNSSLQKLLLIWLFYNTDLKTHLILTIWKSNQFLLLSLEMWHKYFSCKLFQYWYYRRGYSFLSF